MGRRSAVSFRGATDTPAEVAERTGALGEAGVDACVLVVPSNDRRTIDLFVDRVMDSMA